MNPPHPFLHLHRRQIPSDNPTHNNSNSNNNTFDPSSFLHSQPSSSSTFYSTPIVADRTIVTDPRSSSSFSEQHTSSSTPSLPYTTTITPLFRPTPHPTQHESSAALAASSAITASSTEAAAATASNINTVRKSSPSPACEACMVATSESRRQHQQQRAPSPRSTRLPSPRHQQQSQQQQQQQALITPEFNIVQHPIRDTVWIVSALLSLMAHKNDGQYNSLVDPITPFHSRAVPRISIEAYLTRILQFIPFTNEVLLNVLVFLDRIGGLGGMEMTIGALAESHGGSGSGNDSNRVDSSTYPTKDAAVAVPSSTSSHMRSLSSYPSDITSSTGTSFPSSTFTTNSSAATLPRSTSGQVQSSRGHTCHHFARSLSSPSSSSTTARMESSSCINRASFSASASNEADPGSFTPSSSFTSSSSYSSTTSCIHPTTTSNNNNNSNNSDLPIVHKRGRESEIHEHQQQHVNGGGSSLDPSESSTSSSFSSSSTSPSSFSSSSVATTPTPSRSIATVQQQTPYCDGDSRDASERQAKRARFQDPIATERVMTTSSATIDAQITPGGATPALTPKMTAAPNGFRVNSFNIHRLLITCLMVAAKFTSDLFYSNARYAKVGGLSLPELNQLELVFLFTTQFDLNVKEEELQRVGNALLRFKNHRETTANTTASAPVSQPSLPAPPAAIAAQVARTVVVISNSVRHSSSVNLTATINNNNNSDINASNGRYGNAATALRADTSTTTAATTATTSTIANAAAVTAESSSDIVVDPRHQPPRAGRFSIPSPTSPKTGPMSDRGLLQKPIPSQPSSSPSSSTPSSMASTMSTTVSSTATASLHSGSNGGQATTTVVASGSRSQPPQLLSPPEEKHAGWTEGDVNVHMTTPMQTSSSALSSSMPSGPN